uniref:Uncharacterized protein n=1 Tax=Globodera rostochiensis TaxID=31243 RepID=A0A914HJF7_GLORO
MTRCVSAPPPEEHRRAVTLHDIATIATATQHALTAVDVHSHALLANWRTLLPPHGVASVTWPLQQPHAAAAALARSAFAASISAALRVIAIRHGGAFVVEQHHQQQKKQRVQAVQEESWEEIERRRQDEQMYCIRRENERKERRIVEEFEKLEKAEELQEVHEIGATKQSTKKYEEVQSVLEKEELTQHNNVNFKQKSEENVQKEKSAELFEQYREEWREGATYAEEEEEEYEESFFTQSLMTDIGREAYEEFVEISEDIERAGESAEFEQQFEWTRAESLRRQFQTLAEHRRQTDVQAETSSTLSELITVSRRSDSGFMDTIVHERPSAEESAHFSEVEQRTLHVNMERRRSREWSADATSHRRTRRKSSVHKALNATSVVEETAQPEEFAPVLKTFAGAAEHVRSQSGWAAAHAQSRFTDAQVALMQSMYKLPQTREMFTEHTLREKRDERARKVAKQASNEVSTLFRSIELLSKRTAEAEVWRRTAATCESKHLEVPEKSERASSSKLALASSASSYVKRLSLSSGEEELKHTQDVEIPAANAPAPRVIGFETCIEGLPSPFIRREKAVMRTESWPQLTSRAKVEEWLRKNEPEAFEGMEEEENVIAVPDSFQPLMASKSAGEVLDVSFRRWTKINAKADKRMAQQQQRIMQQLNAVAARYENMEQPIMLKSFPEQLKFGVILKTQNLASAEFYGARFYQAEAELIEQLEKDRQEAFEFEGATIWEKTEEFNERSFSVERKFASYQIQNNRPDEIFGVGVQRPERVEAKDERRLRLAHQKMAFQLVKQLLSAERGQVTLSEKQHAMVAEQFKQFGMEEMGMTIVLEQLAEVAGKPEAKVALKAWKSLEESMNVLAVLEEDIGLESTWTTGEIESGVEKSLKLARVEAVQHRAEEAQEELKTFLTALTGLEQFEEAKLIQRVPFKVSVEFKAPESLDEAAQIGQQLAKIEAIGLVRVLKQLPVEEKAEARRRIEQRQQVFELVRKMLSEERGQVTLSEVEKLLVSEQFRALGMEDTAASITLEQIQQIGGMPKAKIALKDWTKLEERLRAKEALEEQAKLQASLKTGAPKSETSRLLKIAQEEAVQVNLKEIKEELLTFLATLMAPEAWEAAKILQRSSVTSAVSAEAKAPTQQETESTTELVRTEQAYGTEVAKQAKLDAKEERRLRLEHQKMAFQLVKQLLSAERGQATLSEKQQAMVAEQFKQFGMEEMGMTVVLEQLAEVAGRPEARVALKTLQKLEERLQAITKEEEAKLQATLKTGAPKAKVEKTMKMMHEASVVFHSKSVKEELESFMQSLLAPEQWEASQILMKATWKTSAEFHGVAPKADEAWLIQQLERVEHMAIVGTVKPIQFAEKAEELRLKIEEQQHIREMVAKMIREDIQIVIGEKELEMVTKKFKQFGLQEGTAAVVLEQLQEVASTEKALGEKQKERAALFVKKLVEEVKQFTRVRKGYGNVQKEREKRVEQQQQKAFELVAKLLSAERGAVVLSAVERAEVAEQFRALGLQEILLKVVLDRMQQIAGAPEAKVALKALERLEKRLIEEEAKLQATFKTGAPKSETSQTLKIAREEVARLRAEATREEILTFLATLMAPEEWEAAKTLQKSAWKSEASVLAKAPTELETESHAEMIRPDEIFGVGVQRPERVEAKDERRLRLAHQKMAFQLVKQLLSAERGQATLSEKQHAMVAEQFKQFGMEEMGMTIVLEQLAEVAGKPEAKVALKAWKSLEESMNVLAVLEEDIGLESTWTTGEIESGVEKSLKLARVEAVQHRAEEAQEELKTFLTALTGLEQFEEAKLIQRVPFKVSVEFKAPESLDEAAQIGQQLAKIEAIGLVRVLKQLPVEEKAEARRRIEQRQQVFELVRKMLSEERGQVTLSEVEKLLVSEQFRALGMEDTAASITLEQIQQIGGMPKAKIALKDWTKLEERLRAKEALEEQAKLQASLKTGAPKSETSRLLKIAQEEAVQVNLKEIKEELLTFLATLMAPEAWEAAKILQRSSVTSAVSAEAKAPTQQETESTTELVRTEQAYGTEVAKQAKLDAKEERRLRLEHQKMAFQLVKQLLSAERGQATLSEKQQAMVAEQFKQFGMEEMGMTVVLEQLAEVAGRPEARVALKTLQKLEERLQAITKEEEAKLQATLKTGAPKAKVEKTMKMMHEASVVFHSKSVKEELESFMQSLLAPEQWEASQILMKATWKTSAEFHGAAPKADEAWLIQQLERVEHMAIVGTLKPIQFAEKAEELRLKIEEQQHIREMVAKMIREDIQIVIGEKELEMVTKKFKQFGLQEGTAAVVLEQLQEVASTEKALGEKQKERAALFVKKLVEEVKQFTRVRKGYGNVQKEREKRVEQQQQKAFELVAKLLSAERGAVVLSAVERAEVAEQFRALGLQEILLKVVLDRMQQIAGAPEAKVALKALERLEKRLIEEEAKLQATFKTGAPKSETSQTLKIAREEVARLRAEATREEILTFLATLMAPEEWEAAKTLQKSAWKSEASVLAKAPTELETESHAEMIRPDEIFGVGVQRPERVEAKDERRLRLAHQKMAFQLVKQLLSAERGQATLSEKQHAMVAEQFKQFGMEEMGMTIVLEQLAEVAGKPEAKVALKAWKSLEESMNVLAVLEEDIGLESTWTTGEIESGVEKSLKLARVEAVQHRAEEAQEELKTFLTALTGLEQFEEAKLIQRVPFKVSVEFKAPESLDEAAQIGQQLAKIEAIGLVRVLKQLPVEEKAEARRRIEQRQQVFELVRKMLSEERGQVTLSEVEKLLVSEQFRALGMEDTAASITLEQIQQIGGMPKAKIALKDWTKLEERLRAKEALEEQAKLQASLKTGAPKSETSRLLKIAQEEAVQVNLKEIKEELLTFLATLMAPEAWEAAKILQRSSVTSAVSAEAKAPTQQETESTTELVRTEQAYGTEVAKQAKLDAKEERRLRLEHQKMAFQLVKQLLSAERGQATLSEKQQAMVAEQFKQFGMEEMGMTVVLEQLAEVAGRPEARVALKTLQKLEERLQAITKEEEAKLQATLKTGAPKAKVEKTMKMMHEASVVFHSKSVKEELESFMQSLLAPEQWEASQILMKATWKTSAEFHGAAPKADEAWLIQQLERVEHMAIVGTLKPIQFAEKAEELRLKIEEQQHIREMVAKMIREDIQIVIGEKELEMVTKKFKQFGLQEGTAAVVLEQLQEVASTEKALGEKQKERAALFVKKLVEEVKQFTRVRKGYGNVQKEREKRVEQQQQKAFELVAKLLSAERGAVVLSAVERAEVAEQFRALGLQEILLKVVLDRMQQIAGAPEAKVALKALERLEKRLIEEEAKLQATFKTGAPKSETSQTLKIAREEVARLRAEATREEILTFLATLMAPEEWEAAKTLQKSAWKSEASVLAKAPTELETESHAEMIRPDEIFGVGVQRPERVEAKDERRLRLAHQKMAFQLVKQLLSAERGQATLSEKQHAMVAEQFKQFGMEEMGMTIVLEQLAEVAGKPEAKVALKAWKSLEESMNVLAVLEEDIGLESTWTTGEIESGVEKSLKLARVEAVQHRAEEAQEELKTFLTALTGLEQFEEAKLIQRVPFKVSVEFKAPESLDEAAQIGQQLAKIEAIGLVRVLKQLPVEEKAEARRRIEQRQQVFELVRKMLSEERGQVTLSEVEKLLVSEQFRALGMEDTAASITLEQIQQIGGMPKAKIALKDWTKLEERLRAKEALEEQAKLQASLKTGAPKSETSRLLKIAQEEAVQVNLKEIKEELLTFLATLMAPEAWEAAKILQRSSVTSAVSAEAKAPTQQETESTTELVPY